MFKVFLIFIIFFCLMAGTDEKNSKRILEENGYKDIQFTGYTLLGCSKDDFYHTGFIAKSTNDRQVSGTVCSGLIFKNSTIRFK